MKKIILIILLISLFIPVLALAQNYGLDATAGAAKLKTDTDLPATAGKVIGTLLSLIGVIFFGLMIYGGFMWMTAQGKEEQAKKALDTIIAAIIGLVIILAAYAITNFVFKSVQPTGGGSAPAVCTGKTGPNNSGCDTCGTDTETSGYQCMEAYKCENGTLQSNYCLAQGQGVDMKCCKESEKCPMSGIQECQGKYVGDTCSVGTSVGTCDKDNPNASCFCKSS